MDFAGNEAELSKEVSSTALLQDTVVEDAALAPELVALVDRELSQVNSILEEAEKGLEKLGQFGDESEVMGLSVRLGKAKADLGGIQKELQDLKAQSLDSVDLEKKLDRLRLNAESLKRDIPDSILLAEQDQFEQVVDESDLESIVRALYLDMEETDVENFVRANFDLLGKYTVGTMVKVFDVGFLDGSSQEFTFVEKEAQLSPDHPFKYLVEDISKSVAISVNELRFSRNDYTVLKEDPVVRFDAASGKLAYAVPKKVGVSDVRKSKTFALLERKEGEPNRITGFSFVEGVGGSVGLVIGIILVVVLAGYYTVLKRSGDVRKEMKEEGALTEKDYYGILEKVNEFLMSGHFDLASNLYNLILTSSQTMPIRNRHLYQRIMDVKNEIDLAYLVKEIEKADFLAKNGRQEAARAMAEDIDFMYQNLDDRFKLKVMTSYAKLRELLK
ncbi:hypothetical protein HY501_03690 [Candidatus Woesearchaeota archaeon]|nr:hypothetical protein [Candidatus Woesearchaeota archaeon]